MSYKKQLVRNTGRPIKCSGENNKRYLDLSARRSTTDVDNFSPPEISPTFVSGLKKGAAVKYRCDIKTQKSPIKISSKILNLLQRQLRYKDDFE